MKQLNLLFIAFLLLLTGSASAQNFDEELDFFMAQLLEVAGKGVTFLEKEESFEKLVQAAKDGAFVGSEHDALKEKIKAFIKLYWERAFLYGISMPESLRMSVSARGVRALRAALDFENPVQTQNGRVKRKKTYFETWLDDLITTDKSYDILERARSFGFFKELVTLIKNGSFKGIKYDALLKQKIRAFIKIYWERRHSGGGFWNSVMAPDVAHELDKLEVALELTPDLDVDAPVNTNTNTNTNTYTYTNTNTNHNFMNSNQNAVGSIALTVPTNFGVQAPHMIGVSGVNSVVQTVHSTMNPYLSQAQQQYVNPPYLPQYQNNPFPLQIQQQPVPYPSQVQQQPLLYPSVMQLPQYVYPQQSIYNQGPVQVIYQQPVLEPTTMATSTTTTSITYAAHEESSSSESDSEEAQAIMQVNAQIIGDHVVEVLNGNDVEARQNLLKKGATLKVPGMGKFSSDSNHNGSLSSATYELLSASYDTETGSYVVKVKQISSGLFWSSVTEVTFTIQGQ